jgi:hypothetical protein
MKQYLPPHLSDDIVESIPNHAGLMCASHDARGAFEGQQELSLLVHHFQYTWKTPF